MGGGHTSDKFLTENCGLLKNLLPGDLVLADRGFTVHEQVWLHQTELNVPAFTRGKQQLDPVDVEKTRKIANVRIHTACRNDATTTTLYLFVKRARFQTLTTRS